MLQDRDGRPTFWCGPGSVVSIAAAQRRSALLTIRAGGSDSCRPGQPVTLVLAGRLVPLHTEHTDGVEVTVVELALTNVFVADGTRHRQDIDVHAYAPRV